MSQEEILEYNKKCAAFLGWDYNKFMDRWNEEDFQHEYSNTNSIDLKFHSDWNWIMEVVEAIEKIDDNFYFVKINTGGCFIHPLNDTRDYKGICYQAGKTKKEAVVQAINQFLIWYEQNK